MRSENYPNTRIINDDDNNNSSKNDDNNNNTGVAIITALAIKLAIRAGVIIIISTARIANRFCR